MIRSVRSALVAVAVLLLVSTPFASASDTVPENPRTISTSGTGVVTVEPDMAIFTIGLEARAETLKPAQDEVTGEVNAIVAALGEAGIEDKDIVTSAYQVRPENKYDRNGNFVRIESYVVRAGLTITVRDIDQVGTLLDQTVTLGADYIGAISFSVSDPSPYIQQARKLAIADAKLKAEDYAIGSDSNLTGLFNLYESSSPLPTANDAERTYVDVADPMAAASEVAENPVDVSAGSTTIMVRVETTWTISPNTVIEPEATPAN